MIEYNKSSVIIDRSIIFIFVFAVFAGIWGFNFRKQTFLCYDAAGYYSYLPAIFIYHDLKYDFVNSLPENSRPKPDGLDVVHIDGNKVAPKWPIGIAILILPFFLLAHITSLISGQPADGYSTIYQYGVLCAAIFYFLAGLLIQKKILTIFYNEKVVAATLIAISLGTNLFWYATYDIGLSHCYGFFLFSFFLYHVIKWHEHPSFKHAVLLGLSLGLITITRPSNLLISVVFLLYNVKSMRDVKEKLYFLTNHFRKLLLLLFCFAVAVSPLLIYWKITSGKFFLDTYPGEKFYFGNPHIFSGLFGFRKGWFIYTPMMLLLIPGIIRIFKTQKPFSMAILVFVIINIYVVFSWWTWWYGGSFSARALVESYAILALPMAASFDLIKNLKASVRNLCACFITALVLLNLFQTYQYVRGIIDFQRMTFKEYVNIFGRTSFPENYNKLLKEPDIEHAEKGLDER